MTASAPRRKPGHPAERIVTPPPGSASTASPARAETAPLKPGVALHGLDALGGLRATLKERTLAREQALAEAARRAHEAEQAANEFRRALGEMSGEMGGEIQPLKAPPRQTPQKSPPAPLPLQTQRDEAAVLSEAISDEYDPEVLLEVDETLSFCRPGVSQEVVRKLRRGTWIVQAQIDLHGLRRDEAREALAAFLREAVKRGLRCVRVIHGKGLGSVNKEPVLKGKVRAWLVQKNEVIAFCQARPHDGGAGAVVVLLQPA